MSDTVQIACNSGNMVLVDAQDAPLLPPLWVTTSKAGIPTAYCSKNKRRASLSRLLMSPSGKDVVDHINGDRLDNRRANLRVCSQANNIRNRKLNKNSPTGFKGVTQMSPQSWRARISAYGIRYALGTFASPRKAHKAYCRAAKILHGEFANFG